MEDIDYMGENASEMINKLWVIIVMLLNYQDNLSIQGT